MFSIGTTPRKYFQCREILQFIAVAFLCTSCVSINLPKNEVSKANNITLKEPDAPFLAIKPEGADRAWRSSTSGNTIAYLTECHAAADSSLKAVETEIFSSLTAARISHSTAVTFSDRDALESSATGNIDGIVVEMNLLIFKKNDCVFTISFMGRSPVNKNDLKKFNQFKENFRVP